jgi:hypothetical protein
MTSVKRGDRFVAYGDWRPSSRLYIEVTRVAKDGTWADIRVQTWAVMWTKRQPLTGGHLPETEPFDWTALDLAKQEVDHMAMLRENGVVR